VHFAHRPSGPRRTFGWLRLTTLAAFINAIALVLITFLSSGKPFSAFTIHNPWRV
jgi:Co/Zn/Cd efflux system component